MLNNRFLAVSLILVYAVRDSASQPAPPNIRRGGPDGSPETMQQTIDRLLKGYSKNTNPTLAIEQSKSINSGTCTVHPATNQVETQIYIHRLSHINEKEGTFDIEGYFRLWWNDPRYTVLQHLFKAS